MPPTATIQSFAHHWRGTFPKQKSEETQYHCGGASRSVTTTEETLRGECSSISGGSSSSNTRISHDFFSTALRLHGVSASFAETWSGMHASGHLIGALSLTSSRSIALRTDDSLISVLILWTNHPFLSARYWSRTSQTPIQRITPEPIATRACTR